MKSDNRDKAADISQTLARGLRLLDAIADNREGVAVRDLAAAVGLPRSIVQRLLHTLEAEGFLERHPSQVGFRLSIKLWSLGCTAVRRLNVRDVARPVLEDLARKTNEMVKIGVLDGQDVVYMDGIECPQAVRAYVPIGGRLPAHSIATGKAILAYLPADKLATTTSAGVNAEALSKELERTRKRGYAINRGERDQEVSAVAAPLFDAHGDAIGSVGVIMPSSRLSSAKIIQLGAWVAAAAAEISRALGYRAAPDAQRLQRAG
jgi:DNA-binding IclR family transcriptional regulator